MMDTCKKCGETKDVLTEFPLTGNGEFGHRRECRVCWLAGRNAAHVPVVRQPQPCVVCDAEFVPRREGHIFCSGKCYKKSWEAKNPAYGISRYYELTTEGFHRLLVTQGGKCAICQDPMKKPCVDHDHETGRVRALLCTGCNVGIGMFNEDPDRLEKAIVYLKFQELAIGHAGNKTPAEKGL